ncbi:MAG: N5-glutamine methyltransferase family protein [Candidatus Nanopelagicales bacterium]
MTSGSLPPDRVVEGWLSLRDVLADGQRRLMAAGVPSPEVDAALLAAHVMGVPRGRLLLHDRMPADLRMAYERLLTRRMARVPLQHLLGSAPFRTIELSVGPGVFVPRPETELLAGAAIDALKALPPEERIAVDLCAGSGAVALAVAIETGSCRVTAVELDPAAVRWTRANVERHADALAKARSEVQVAEADATRCAGPAGSLAGMAGEAAVVTMNPPYVPQGAVVRDPEVREHDPPRALYGGPDGLVVTRGAIDTAATLLRAGGLVLIEHSDEQGESAGESGVPGILRADSRWRDVADHLDLARKPRFTTATRSA